MCRTHVARNVSEGASLAHASGFSWEIELSIRPLDWITTSPRKHLPRAVIQAYNALHHQATVVRDTIRDLANVASSSPS